MKIEGASIIRIAQARAFRQTKKIDGFDGALYA
jgi:hypothetical protein